MGNNTHNVKTRPMQPKDVESCAAIIASTPLWQGYGVTLPIAIDRINAALDGGAGMVVAVVDNSDDPDAARGFAWIAPRGMFDRSGYIRWFAVNEQWRGAGIGVVLLTAAEDYVRQLSTDIFLLCADFNVIAARFYERNGYTLVAAMPDYVIPGTSELIYRKRL